MPFKAYLNSHYACHKLGTQTSLSHPHPHRHPLSKPECSLSPQPAPAPVGLQFGFITDTHEILLRQPSEPPPHVRKHPAPRKNGEPERAGEAIDQPARGPDPLCRDQRDIVTYHMAICGYRAGPSLGLGHPLRHSNIKHTVDQGQYNEGRAFYETGQTRYLEKRGGGLVRLRIATDAWITPEIVLEGQLTM